MCATCHDIIVDWARDLDDKGRMRCSDCSGRGVKPIGPGAVVNGVFRGPTGQCYRCGGKGFQTRADIKRNVFYDNHYRRIPMY